MSESTIAAPRMRPSSTKGFAVANIFRARICEQRRCPQVDHDVAEWLQGGGRRFCVEITSDDLKTALNEIADHRIHKATYRALPVAAANAHDVAEAQTQQQTPGASATCH